MGNLSQLLVLPKLDEVQDSNGYSIRTSLTARQSQPMGETKQQTKLIAISHRAARGLPTLRESQISRSTALAGPLNVPYPLTILQVNPPFCLTCSTGQHITARCVDIVDSLHW